MILSGQIAYIEINLLNGMSFSDLICIFAMS